MNSFPNLEMGTIVAVPPQACGGCQMRSRVGMHPVNIHCCQYK